MTKQEWDEIIELNDKLNKQLLERKIEDLKFKDVFFRKHMINLIMNNYPDACIDKINRLDNIDLTILQDKIYEMERNKRFETLINDITSKD